MTRQHYAQIDIMKGLAILGVLFTHALTVQSQHRVLTVFHANQAVPVFIVLMAMNLNWSLKRAGGVAAAHFGRRMRRLLVPLGLILVASTLIATVRYFTLGELPDVGWISLLGYLPFGGPGNYFIGVLITLTAVGPFLWAWYVRQPVVAVGSMLAADILFEIAAGRLPASFGDTSLYAVCALRLLGAFAIGLWLADGWSLRDARNRWLWAYAALSVAYVAANQLGYRIPWIQGPWQPLNVVSFGYTALLVMLGMKLPPVSAPRHVWALLAELGKASYHIYLVQMLYFGFITRFQLIPLVSDMVRPTALGWAFFRLDRRMRWSSGQSPDSARASSR